MAHPKRRQSHTRGAKRRTHYKAETPNVTVCPVTGTMHVMHRAYYVDGDLYYRGQLVMAAAMRATHFFVFFEKNRGDVLHATKICLSLHRQSTMESLGKPNFGFFS